jgi:hypothetical protein
MSSTSERTIATTRFGAQQRKGVLLGFSAPRLLVLAIALTVTVGALFSRGLGGLLLVAPILAVLAASAFVRVGGRTAIEWAPVAGHWGLRRVMRQDIYLVRPTKPRPAGNLALPGDAAALRVHLDPVTSAAMIHDPHRHTLAVTCEVRHPAFVLLDLDDQARRVTAWGRALAVLARTGHIAAIQVLEATVPDNGAAVLDHWEDAGIHDDSWASINYRDFVRDAAPASARHRTTITLSLDLRKAARAIAQAGHGIAGAAAVLRQHMAVLEAALRTAELHPTGWLSEQRLAAQIRAAFDPTTEPSPERGSAAAAGPVGVREHWSWLEIDQAAAAVLWVCEWPRSAAYPNFLHPLVLHPTVRKTVCLLAKPIPTGDARREIRRQKVEYLTDAEHKARVGQVTDLSDRQEYQDILDREAEINVGHADMRFTGLIAITTADKTELDAAVADMEQAALHAECETRLLVGQQAQAFAAAALPLARGLG